MPVYKHKTILEPLRRYYWYFILEVSLQSAQTGHQYLTLHVKIYLHFFVHIKRKAQKFELLRINIRHNFHIQYILGFFKINEKQDFSNFSHNARNWTDFDQILRRSSYIVRSFSFMLFIIIIIIIIIKSSHPSTENQGSHNTDKAYDSVS